MKEQVWAMEPSFLLSYLEKVENIPLNLPKAWFDDDDDEDDNDPKYEVDEDGIAHVSISGPLSAAEPSRLAKFFGYSGTSYGSIINGLKAAESDPNVKGVQLDVNSPGGEINGVDSVWSAIRAMSKPTFAMNTGMMASAAYWIGSACDKIGALNPTCETGSIGVVIAGIDDSDALGKMGIKRVQIYSKNAPNKAMTFSSEKGRELLQSRVDAQERVFQARVAEGRGVPAGEVSERFGAGGIFIASDPDKSQQDALSVGLIDQVGGSWTPNPTGTGFRGQVATLTRPILTQEAKPALAGVKTQEVTSMTLEELLAQSAEARAQLEEIKTKARAEGVASVDQRIKAAVPFLSSTEYPKAVTDLALKVIAGEVGKDILTASVAIIDSMKEKNAAQAAAGGNGTASFKVDKDGNAILGTDGKPVPAGTSETAAQSHQTGVQRIDIQPKAGPQTAAEIDALAKADRGGV